MKDNPYSKPAALERNALTPCPACDGVGEIGCSLCEGGTWVYYREARSWWAAQERPQLTLVTLAQGEPQEGA